MEEEVSFFNCIYPSKSITETDVIHVQYRKETRLKNVMIPNCRKIWKRGLEEAFTGCTNVQSVNIPNVVEVEDYGMRNAFFGCKKLYLFHPDPNPNPYSRDVRTDGYEFRLEKAGKNAFESCFANCLIFGMNRVVVQPKGETFHTVSNPIRFDRLTEVGDYCFSGCFRNCVALRSIHYPKLETCSEGCFQNAFIDCDDLVTVDFPVLKTIGEKGFQNAFAGCSKLEVLEFPEVTETASQSFEGAFARCKNLKVVSFPKLGWDEETQKFDVTKIADDTFESLFSLTWENGKNDETRFPEDLGFSNLNSTRLFLNLPYDIVYPHGEESYEFPNFLTDYLTEYQIMSSVISVKGTYGSIQELEKVFQDDNGNQLEYTSDTFYIDNPDYHGYRKGKIVVAENGVKTQEWMWLYYSEER